jgi:hypothetical protein
MMQQPLRVATTEADDRPAIASGLLSSDIPNCLNFEVETRDIFDRRGKKIPNRLEVVRKDDERHLSVVSNTYQLRQFKDFYTEVLDAIWGCNLLDKSDVSANHYIDNDGGRYLGSFTFNRNRGIRLFDDNENERNVFRINMRSSHDMWSAEVFNFDALYLWCKNGSARREWGIRIMNRHNNKVRKTLEINHIAEAIQAFNEDQEQMKKFCKIQVELPAVKHLFKKTLVKEPDEKYWNRWKEQWNEYHLGLLMEIYKQYYDHYGPILFAVYQTATHWATHIDKTRGKVYNVQDRRMTKVNSMMNSNYWNELQ